MPGAFAVQIRAHRQRDPVAAHAGGDEHLLAVDHIVVAVEPGGGAQRGHIRSAAGFGDAECRNLFAAQHGRNDLGLQLGRTVFQDRRQADVVREEAGHHAAAAAKTRERLRQRIARAPGRGRAAQVLGVAEAEQAERGGLLVQRARKLTGFVPRGHVRRNGLRGETLHRVDERGSVFGGVHAENVTRS